MACNESAISFIRRTRRKWKLATIGIEIFHSSKNFTCIQRLINARPLVNQYFSSFYPSYVIHSNNIYEYLFLNFILLKIELWNFFLKHLSEIQMLWWSFLSIVTFFNTFFKFHSSPYFFQSKYIKIAYVS